VRLLWQLHQQLTKQLRGRRIRMRNTGLVLSIRIHGKEPEFKSYKNYGDENGPETWTTTSPELDAKQTFSLFMTTQDFKAFGGDQINKPISADWNKATFEREIPNIKPLIYKKMSEKSLLIGYFSNIECSPSLIMMVLTPLNSRYANFGVTINGGFDSNPIIKNKDTENVRNGDDSCDLESEFTQIAKQVQDGNYSEDLYRNIKIARQIADSVETE